METNLSINIVISASGNSLVPSKLHMLTQNNAGLNILRIWKKNNNHNS